MTQTDLLLPLPQSPEFARTADAIGMDVRSMKWERGGEIALRWQVQARRFGPLGRVDLISRGPVARRPADLQEWLQNFRRWQDGRPLLLNADGLEARELRDAGFWPMVTPASVALVSLGQTDAMRAGLAQKWRNRLNRAEDAGLTVTRRPLTADHWLLGAEAAQARARGYKGWPPAFSLAYAQRNAGKALVWEARRKGTPVAAALVLRHGRMATWQIGVSRDAGRKGNAMNLLLWRAMDWLAHRGHDCLDLGMVNSEDAPGLARFKLGTGATLQRLGGSWLHFGALAPIARCLPVGQNVKSAA